MIKDSKTPKFKVKIAENEDLFDISLCAREYIDFLDDFRNKFMNKQYFILTAYERKTLIGILIAEDVSKDVDSLENVLPKIRLNLLYVSPEFRHLNLGVRLMTTFIMIKKKEGFAGIIVKLPMNYKKGMNYFLNNDFLNYKFHLKGIQNSKIELEVELWNNFGICEYESIDTLTYDI